ncbi:MAG: hypothetical protein M3162_05785 [Thermoproteota archaeon]|nr:hypothetical protein [Thermoproteota archaeon]
MTKDIESVITNDKNQCSGTLTHPIKSNRSKINYVCECPNIIGQSMTCKDICQEIATDQKKHHETTWKGKNLFTP